MTKASDAEAAPAVVRPSRLVADPFLYGTGRGARPRPPAGSDGGTSDPGGGNTPGITGAGSRLVSGYGA